MVRGAAAVLALLILLPCVLTTGVSAQQPATPADYRARVSDALLALDALSGTDAEPGANSRADEERRVAASVMQKLPPRERVGRGTVEVNNAWLHAGLEAFLREAEPDERAARRARLTEQLSALRDRLDETADAAAATTARDKDMEKGRLAAILRRPEYQPKAEQETALQRVVRRIQEWARSLIPEMSPVVPGATPGATRATQIAVYALALVVVGLVLWRYGPALWRRFRKGGRGKKAGRERGARVVLGEVVGAEQTAIDLLADAERAARAGDLRGAVRKAYVALLTALGDRGLLRLARHKTNRDYLAEVRARAELHREVCPLTEAFERHWYGGEDVTADDWNTFRARCRQLTEQS